MVSLKKIFGCLKVLSLFMLFLSAGMFSFAATINTDLLICRTGYKKCCVDGVMTCVEDTGQVCLIACEAVGFEPIETCTVGNIQYKPSGSCGTSERTCCSDKSWSEWDKECPKTCDNSTKPTSSQSCGTNGTQTRTVTCDSSTGEWTTGSWGTCKEQVCSKGDMRTCPSNSKKVQYCLSDGSGWATSCSCENPGNGKVYCQGMPLTTAEANTCYHGIWSDETCSGICCCEGDTPKLMSNGYPGCWGTNKDGLYMWQYACVCSHYSGGSGGLLPAN